MTDSLQVTGCLTIISSQTLISHSSSPSNTIVLENHPVMMITTQYLWMFGSAGLVRKSGNSSQGCLLLLLIQGVSIKMLRWPAATVSYWGIFIGTPCTLQLVLVLVVPGPSPCAVVMLLIVDTVHQNYCDLFVILNPGTFIKINHSLALTRICKSWQLCGFECSRAIHIF